MRSPIGKVAIYLAWIVAICSTVLSLYFSEIRHFPPCSLCWYQRVLMFPLAIIIPVGILKKDKFLDFYVLPLSILGMLLALYQHLLEIGIIKQSLCSIGVSCSVKYINWLNVVTLPLLSFIAFSFISIFVLLYKKSFRK